MAAMGVNKMATMVVFFRCSAMGFIFVDLDGCHKCVVALL